MSSAYKQLSYMQLSYTQLPYTHTTHANSTQSDSSHPGGETCQQGCPGGHGMQHTGHGEFLVQYTHTLFKLRSLGYNQNIVWYDCCNFFFPQRSLHVSTIHACTHQHIQREPLISVLLESQPFLGALLHRGSKCSLLF